jgi:hypothetical protein
MDEPADRERGGDEGDGGVGRQREAARAGRSGRRPGARPGRRGRRDARAAQRGRGAERRRRSRPRVAEQRERVDVAAAVAGTAGAESQPPGWPERPQPPPGRRVIAAAHFEPAEAQVGRDEAAAADGHRQALARRRAGEADAAGAGGANRRAWSGCDVDPPPLPASERRVRRDAESPDHPSPDGPAPGGMASDRRRAPLPRPFARQRPPRRDEERHDEARDREGDEDDRVRARGHRAEGRRAVARGRRMRVICCWKCARWCR